VWIALAVAAALFQVLRNTAMKRLGHALDEYINVWGRFTFLLPFALLGCVLGGFPTLKPGFFGWCVLFGVCQTLSTLLLGMAWVTIGEKPTTLGVIGVFSARSASTC
jgi:hypothetical protein